MFNPKNYLSAIGWICQVPRPQLVLAELDGEPVVEYGTGKLFTELLGILECQYKSLSLDAVVYELGDGTLLLANKEVLQKAEIAPSYQWKGHNCLVSRVSDLQIIQEMPEPVERNIPVFHF